MTSVCFGIVCVQILCKPKIMPLKSITLEKLEEMQKQMAEFNKDQEDS